MQEGAGIAAVVNGIHYDVNFRKRGASAEVVAAKTREIHALREQIAPMEERKAVLDVQAARSANRKIWAAVGWLFVQGAVVTKLTFFSRFGWDVMEPITYLLTFSTMFGGLLFFQFHKIEYTYPALYNLLARRKRARLFQSTNFPQEQYKQLESAIRMAEAELRSLMPAAKQEALMPAPQTVAQPRWLHCVDEVTGMYYYYHTLTGESRMQRPGDFGLHFEIFSDSKTGAS